MHRAHPYKCERRFPLHTLAYSQDAHGTGTDAPSAPERWPGEGAGVWARGFPVGASFGHSTCRAKRPGVTPFPVPSSAKSLPGVGPTWVEPDSALSQNPGWGLGPGPGRRPAETRGRGGDVSAAREAARAAVTSAEPQAARASAPTSAARGSGGRSGGARRRASPGAVRPLPTSTGVAAKRFPHG